MFSDYMLDECQLIYMVILMKGRIVNSFMIIKVMLLRLRQSTLFVESLEIH